ncbi:MAG: mechanosensitive ion channel family protein, partial [Prochlorothrix sp.]
MEQSLWANWLIQILLGGLILGLTGLGLWVLEVPQRLQQMPQWFQSEATQTFYQQVLQPHRSALQWTSLSVGLDLALIALPLTGPVAQLEFVLGLVVALQVAIVGIRVVNQWFDSYGLTLALAEDKRINSEFLLLARFAAQLGLCLATLFIFAETHTLNLVGLLASIGIGGVALAFASQKIVEQLLWSVVIYIDRPFEVGDYIHLPDRTLGKVEEVGWRSTKIRLSGKNTLSIIPNSHLAQVNIENLSRAQRVILMIGLSFFEPMVDEEKALVRQLILESTVDILGIDHSLTEVSFQVPSEPESPRIKLKAQSLFFILG